MRGQWLSGWTVSVSMEATHTHWSDAWNVLPNWSKSH